MEHIPCSWIGRISITKSPCHPKQFMDSYHDSNDVFHRTRTNISKIYMEPQKAPHSNSDTEKTTKLEESHYLISNYTTTP